MRRPLATLAALAALSACGGTSASGPQVLDHIGRIPGAKSAGVSVDINGANLSAPAVQGNVLGAKATGNRLLIIGDSILAGTAARYGNEMCNTLVPMGWSTVVEAEAGQPATFGREVLRARIYEGWDAAVVFLGTNPSANIDRYEQDMTRIVESLAPRPTLLLTTTLFRASQQATNDVIRRIASSHDNVSILDWGTASIQPGVLNADGVHPTTAGRTLLVRSIAAAVGAPPVAKGGNCLPAQFTDDSMGRENMPSTTVAGQSVVPVTSTSVAGSTGASTTTTSTAPVTSTTVQTAATTTTRP